MTLKRVHFAVKSLRYANSKPRMLEEKRSEKRKQRRKISVCTRSTKWLWFYSAKVAVRKLEKRQKNSSHLWQKQGLRQKTRHEIRQKIKQEIKKKLITRKTKLNRGVNRAIRYAKIIKRIFPKKQASAITPPRTCPARTGRVGGGARARVVSQSLLIPF